MDLGGGWLKWRSLSRPTPDVIVLNGNSERFCIQCGQDYNLAFFYSNGRGGKRPRCKGCMMTRRHNLKRARLGLPPYPAAAPYVPLRTQRASDPRQMEFDFLRPQDSGEAHHFRVDDALDGLFWDLMREEMDRRFPDWREAWDGQTMPAETARRNY
jgi:hypothetical protein